MIVSRTLTAVLLAGVAATITACSALTPRRPPSPAATPVVLGAAIVAPDTVAGAVADATRSDPAAAAPLAAAAVAAAPERAAAIREAAIREAPEHAGEVVAATTVKPPVPTARVEIPAPERVASLVDDADRASGDVVIGDQVSPRFSSRGVARFGSGLAHTLVGLGRSVRQFVEDLR